jgi:hypothetical protein
VTRIWAGLPWIRRRLPLASVSEKNSLHEQRRHGAELRLRAHA